MRGTYECIYLCGTWCRCRCRRTGKPLFWCQRLRQNENDCVDIFDQLSDPKHTSWCIRLSFFPSDDEPFTNAHWHTGGSCTVSAGIFCGISVFIYVQYPFDDVHLNRGIKDSVGSADIFFCFEYYYGSLDGGRTWIGCIWCSPCNFDRTGHFCGIFIRDLFLPDAPI